MGHSFWQCCQTSHFNILVFQTVLNACLCVCSWIHKKRERKKIRPDGHQCSLKARLMWPFTQRAKALLCQTLKPQCPLSSNESSTVTEDCQLKRRHWDTNVIKAPLVDRHPYHRCQRQKLYLLELSVTAWRINPFCQEQRDQIVIPFFQSLRWFLCTWTEQKVLDWAAKRYVQIVIV